MSRQASVNATRARAVDSLITAAMARAHADLAQRFAAHRYSESRSALQAADDLLYSTTTALSAAVDAAIEAGCDVPELDL
jgi:hypothetical protein